MHAKPIEGLGRIEKKEYWKYFNFPYIIRGVQWKWIKYEYNSAEGRIWRIEDNKGQRLVDDYWASGVDINNESKWRQRTFNKR